MRGGLTPAFSGDAAGVSSLPRLFTTVPVVSWCFRPSEAAADFSTTECRKCHREESFEWFRIADSDFSDPTINTPTFSFTSATGGATSNLGRT